MSELIFASNNTHKIAEVSAIAAPYNIRIVSMREAGIDLDVEETGTTFRDNAALKATAIFERTGRNCFADDSGLEVEALHGEPGVYSARYAGDHGNHEANNRKLLLNLSGKNNRKAAFVTVVALILNGQTCFFEGRIEGRIAEHPSGNNGFGYDPVFVPEGHQHTFAEMPSEEKNAISHRKLAITKMVAYLHSISFSG